LPGAGTDVNVRHPIKVITVVGGWLSAFRMKGPEQIPTS